MKASVHLTFNGQCEAAFLFYQRCLGSEIVTLLSYGDSPVAADTPLDWHDKIIHASLVTGSNTFAGADLLPIDFEEPKGFFVLLEIEDVAEAERVFLALSENATIRLPMQKTFWAARFGVLIDQFGIPWEINCGGRE